MQLGLFAAVVAAAVVCCYAGSVLRTFRAAAKRGVSVQYLLGRLGFFFFLRSLRFEGRAHGCRVVISRRLAFRSSVALAAAVAALFSSGKAPPPTRCYTKSCRLCIRTIDACKRTATRQVTRKLYFTPTEKNKSRGAPRQRLDKGNKTRSEHWVSTRFSKVYGISSETFSTLSSSISVPASQLFLNHL